MGKASVEPPSGCAPPPVVVVVVVMVVVVVVVVVVAMHHGMARNPASITSPAGMETSSPLASSALT